MPSNRMKVCPRCRRLVPDIGRTYCADCDVEYRAERAARRRETRDWAAEYGARADDDPKYRAFYRSRQWRETSRRYAMLAGHICEECGDTGTDVHHVIPIQCEAGWNLRFSFSNLKLLCVPCHNRAHRRFS
ncbi:HNH endonuclease [Adlercreutzia caecimuris]|uniref:HNH endonuclease n=1 Tax=Adlercreutzia caecimuris TaxID=671266 RepID=A0A4S4G2V6_9ACTN|nr:HNH endonuclease signature motif containing protein [Adlercreutzia caecimuris]THG36845.1 HNH endonuclease [Adlercreutzia caecimuris]